RQPIGAAFRAETKLSRADIRAYFKRRNKLYAEKPPYGRLGVRLPSAIKKDLPPGGRSFAFKAYL
ncbi:MAG: hypothetical protein IKB04_09025, partial [Clostridia bacterium]|nr:hypothetical protein [Clostridia bacterium]